MEIRLSEHFSYGKLLRFTFPSVAMMLFCSIYGMVDGFFVSNYVGATQFAALNLIWPYTMVLGAVGFMIGSGGTALVSKTLGEGKPKLANEYFSMMIYAAIVIGLFLDILGLSLMRPVARLMGADGELLEYAVQYGNIIMAAMPTFMLQCVFQPFMVTAERARLGLWFTVASGLTNMFFDWLFIGVFGWGIRAAAAATVLSQVVGFALPMIYFLRRNNSLLHLGRPSTDMRAFFKACSNGMSELVTALCGVSTSADQVMCAAMLIVSMFQAMLFTATCVVFVSPQKISVRWLTTNALAITLLAVAVVYTNR